MTLFQDRIAEAVHRIPRRRWATYGDVARIVGKPGAARAVAAAMIALDTDMPSWRVLKCGGVLPKVHGSGQRTAQDWDDIYWRNWLAEGLLSADRKLARPELHVETF